MNNNQNKKLLLLILALIMIAVSLLVVYFWPNNNNSNNNNNNTTITVPDGNTEIDTPVSSPKTKDLTVSFLQMENNKNNMIYSPLSIKYALSMVSTGASGETKNQIDALLPSKVLTKYSYVKDKLSLANSIFINKSFENNIKASYINDLQSKYNADVLYDDFTSTDNMNRWISEKTFGLIKSSIPEISQSDKLVLINALAIDANWKLEFENTSTNGKTFYLENGDEINATTMSNRVKSDDYSYYIDNSITVLSGNLEPLGTTNLEFLAIMPNDLSSYINTITEDEINNIASKLIKSSTEKDGILIQIPKFKYEYDLSFLKDLSELGIKDMFDSSKADFSNISSDSLYISAAIHKANIEFSERGIKAAAVTAFTLSGSAFIEDENLVEVIINKPFMYVIRDKDTKEIWFIGSVYTPNKWEDDKESYYR